MQATPTLDFSSWFVRLLLFDDFRIIIVLPLILLYLHVVFLADPCEKGHYRVEDEDVGYRVAEVAHAPVQKWAEAEGVDERV